MMRPASLRRTIRAALAVGGLVTATACAYFNGLYNSREEERKADQLLRTGGEASLEFRSSAEKAETVLTRYPKTRWRARALYLAGRGHAYSNDCVNAVPRLTEFLSMRALGEDERARAVVALASCEVQAGHFTAARESLAPLLTYRRREVATEASLWSARAALALNDGEGARRDLARIGSSAAAWELFAASMERSEYERAESLLVSRAREGDYRDEVRMAAREFWRAGRRESAERIAALYEASRMRPADKTRLQVELADLTFRAGLDTAAERHLATAKRYTADPFMLRAIAARRLAVRIARSATTAEAEAALRTDSAAARGEPLLSRLADNVLLVKMLETHRDLSGASDFLAAEVARDSLSAPLLAHALFVRVLRDAAPNSTLPPRALLAAALVHADSADAYRARVTERYPKSPWSALLRGVDPGQDPVLLESDATLRTTWLDVLRIYADSLALRHPAADTTGRSGLPGLDAAGAARGRCADRAAGWRTATVDSMTRTAPDVGRLGTRVAGLDFQNPVILAAGTAAYGRELAGVVDLDALGGIVTKAVSLLPREGNAAPRVGEFAGGMINAVGLANPGVEAVRRDHLPWLAASLRRARVLVNVVGHAVGDFAGVVEQLDGAAGIDAFELNVSCPNVKAGGLEFGADPAALAAVVTQARARTRLPLFVKLSPTLGDVAAAAGIAADAGADGVSLVNTIPGLVIDVERRRPALGFGSGGVSGAPLLPVGVLATWRVSRAHPALPIIGVGGVASATDLIQYVLAGASLVGVGTAAMRDPRLPERIVAELDRWCGDRGIARLSELRGALEWPS